MALTFYLTNVNGTVFFQATDEITAHELWKTDGTSAGTGIVKDINRGGPYYPIGSRPDLLFNLNGMLYFQANDGINGDELWKSDGTSTGTELVRDINIGAADSTPIAFTELNGSLLFTANDTTHGFELWKSDGSSSGTHLVKDIRSGGLGSGSVVLRTGKYNLNEIVFLSADDGSSGKELWKSDGTSTGTILVKDIHIGVNGSFPRYLEIVGNHYFFVADDGINGSELWTSDGTSTGTVLVKDIYAGSNGSNPKYLTNVNGTLYFTANNGVNGVEIWKSDGSSEGTVLVKDIRIGEVGSSPKQLRTVNDILFFYANDGIHGYELWRTLPNSAPTGTTLSWNSIAENERIGSTVGDFATTDPDPGNSFLYSLAGGVGSGNNDCFAIVGSTLISAAVFDFETKSSYSIRVRTTDLGGLTYDKVFTISVTDVNEAPTNLELSATSIPDSQPVGATVGTFRTTDPDAGNTFTYSLVAGAGDADNASFSIDGHSLKIAAGFADEAKNSFTIRVRSTDQGGLTYDKAFTLTIDDQTAPTSHVTPLPATIAAKQFTVAWGGEDNLHGVWIAHYDVYVSDNGGAYALLIGGTTATFTEFVGEDGHTYAFYSIATDLRGNVEEAPTEADAVTLVDVTPPASAVDALPTAVTTPTFTLRWSGADTVPGSGLAQYRVYVSDNGAAYALLVNNTTATSVDFTGEVGHTYRFYSVAIDAAGNVEGAPAIADAQVTVIEAFLNASLVAVDPNPRRTSVASVEIDFNVAIDPASLTPARFLLSRNGGGNLLTGSETFTHVSGNRWRLDGLAALTAEDGTHTLSLDLTGMRDQWGVPGVGQASLQWLLDTVRPTSTLAPLPVRATSPSFTLEVQANDPAASNGGPASGLAAWEIYVAVDGGAWSLWRTGLFQDGNTAVFAAEGKRSYAFRTLVRDRAGNVESKGSTVIDASTYVPDLLAPDTAVTALNSTTSNLALTIDGRDLGRGTLASFDIYVSIDRAAPVKITRLTAGAPDANGNVRATLNYQAQADGLEHTYRFYSIGIDDAGNVEAAPGGTGDIERALTFAPVPLRATSIDVQRGDVQRSLVRYLDVFFNRDGADAIAATLTDANAANDRIRLRRFALDGTGTGTLVSLAGKVTVTGTQLSIDFGAGGLSDGYYRLELDNDNDLVIDQQLHFYRLQGDLNGDRKVDSADLTLLTKALGLVGTGLYQDLNGDGKVDQKDRVLLGTLVGRKLAPDLVLDD